MSLNSPLFSIVIPTFNREKQLHQCLGAIQKLDYSRNAFEVVVVDDEGEQDLTDVCSVYESNIQISLIRKTNGGPASARNEGACFARGNYLIFTDDDCELHVEYLSVLEKLIRNNPECMIGGYTTNRLKDNLYSKTSQLIVDVVYRHYNSSPGNVRFLASNNMTVPKAQFDKIGGFDLTFYSAASEDRELCSRWLMKENRIIYDAELIVYHSHGLTLKTFVKQHFNYLSIARLIASTQQLDQSLPNKPTCIRKLPYQEEHGEGKSGLLLRSKRVKQPVFDV